MRKYQQRRCRICHAPVDQANDDLREPLCSEHRWEQINDDLVTGRKRVCAIYAEGAAQFYRERFGIPATDALQQELADALYESQPADAESQEI